MDSRRKPRIGLALSGGGLRGLAHVGVLQVLEEAQVPVDAIAISGAEDHAWNAVVAGFGGRISDRMGSAMKRRWGRASYLRAALGELRDLRPHRIGLTVDGRTAELDVLMVVLANGRYAGGGIPFAPGAHLDDGWIDVVAIPDVPPWRLPGIIARVLSGRHLADPRITHDRGRRIEVEAGSGFWFNVDGESWRDGGARFEITPRALPFVRPGS